MSRDMARFGDPPPHPKRAMDKVNTRAKANKAATIFLISSLLSRVNHTLENPNQSNPAWAGKAIKATRRPPLYNQ
jgi:hypothetical protein